MLLVIFILVDVPRSLNDGHHTFGQVIRTVQRYFAIKFFTSLLTGGMIAAWLMILDVQYPLLWGFLAFLFNFRAEHRVRAGGDPRDNTHAVV